MDNLIQVIISCKIYETSVRQVSQISYLTDCKVLFIIKTILIQVFCVLFISPIELKLFMVLTKKSDRVASVREKCLVNAFFS